MKAEELYILWQKTKCKLFGVPYQLPKDWIKVYARKDWVFFEKLAKIITKKKIDPYLFFISNFVIRNGEFYPSMFLRKRSFINYKAFIHKNYAEVEAKDLMMKLVRQGMIFIKNYKKRGWIDEWLFTTLLDKKKIDFDFLAVLFSVLEERERRTVEFVVKDINKNYNRLTLLARFRQIEVVMWKFGRNDQLIKLQTLLRRKIYG